MSDRVDEEKRATLRRFAALGAATPFVGSLRGDEHESTSDARDAIVGYLAATPGAHFSKVRDDLKLGTGETQHHLKRLLSDGVVESRRDGDYRRFFPAGRFGEFEQTALGYLRRRTPRGMLIELLRNPDATGSDLAAALDVSRATVSNYAKDLDAAGLLSREDGYRVESPETVITLLLRYADSFGEDAATFASDADRFIRFDP
ncbi:Predicted transcriptional regulator, containsd two HTH domains [Halogranum gelatinilyticum]|uniref:Predicted transcriptional regulator, containsd two HTH domains n=1 Tax=Halogranum gelatinilyticum TaxID=660521 RepID=A0A1G9QEC9_9EURY|nr:MarR family transcriptional regulator [Halogranum gelatinilyticum]SDM09323.1 Predicted transcriptional regulator, containsd two HTH domains [Halogranum gelatinilyticum]